MSVDTADKIQELRFAKFDYLGNTVSSNELIEICEQGLPSEFISTYDLLDDIFKEIHKKILDLIKPVNDELKNLKGDYITAELYYRIKRTYTEINQILEDLKRKVPTLNEIKTIRSVLHESEVFKYGFIKNFIPNKIDATMPTGYANEFDFYKGMFFGTLLKKTEGRDKNNSILGDVSTLFDELIEIASAKKNSIKELEELYEEKLRFSSSATYWGNLKKTYYHQALIWFSFAIILAFIVVVFGIHMLGNFNEYIPSVEDYYGVIKSTIIFSVVISFVYYAIHHSFKIALSSLHLHRDAYEREQLTHLYLSLKNEKAVEEADRIIILQSLFSRADTGLIKGDSSPSIPNAITNAISTFGSRREQQ